MYGSAISSFRPPGIDSGEVFVFTADDDARSAARVAQRGRHLDGRVACRHCNSLWYAARRTSSYGRKALAKRKIGRNCLDCCDAHSTSATGHEQTWWLKFVMSAFPASGHERRSDKVGSPSEVCGVRFRFLGWDFFRKKRNGIKAEFLCWCPGAASELFTVFNGLACPTFANRPIESQWIFLRLSHRFSAASHVRFSPHKRTSISTVRMSAKGHLRTHALQQNRGDIWN